MTPALYVTLFFIILGILGLIRWSRMGFKRSKYPLWFFVLVIAIVWAIILLVAWSTGGPAEFNKFYISFRAYAIGMLVMYIGMKVYKG